MHLSLARAPREGSENSPRLDQSGGVHQERPSRPHGVRAIHGSSEGVGAGVRGLGEHAPGGAEGGRVLCTSRLAMCTSEYRMKDFCQEGSCRASWLVAQLRPPPNIPHVKALPRGRQRACLDELR